MRVLAVVVTYQPDIGLLAKVLGSAAPQVERIVIVDNGSDNVEEIAALVSEVRGDLQRNDANVGIAAAQNCGVDVARRGDFSSVLLLDQDTVLGATVVADLSRQLQDLRENGQKPAAIGPAYLEINSERQTQGYRAKGLRILRIPLVTQTEPVATDFIIASGSLIPMEVLNKVGGFDETFFIDLVDTEWCFRARAAGYTSFISPKTSVDHRLGAGTLRLGTRQIALHVPIRNYYWVRNAIWLARRRYTPPAWRLYFVTRCFAFLAIYPIVAAQRGTRLRLIGRGFRDGFLGRLGPYKPR